MAKFLNNNFNQGKLTSKTYELTCIEAPKEERLQKYIHVGKPYICSDVVAVNWELAYAVDLGNGGLEVPKECFEPLPIE